MGDEKMEKLAQLIGLDAELIKELKVDDLTDEKINFLEQITSLYLTDKKNFAQFLNQSGVGELLVNLNTDEDINNDEQLAKVVDDIKKVISEHDTDINLEL